MKYNPDKHHRRSLRLKGYDYSSSGMYFITLCTHQRQCLFGEIEKGEMYINEFGNVVANTHVWLETQYSHVYWDAWVIMPNHVHGILVLTDVPGRGGSRTAPTSRTAPVPQNIPTSRTAPVPQNIPTLRTVPTGQNFPIANGTNRKSLGRLIGAFKTVSSKQINLIRDTPGSPVWQRNYYEHIVCSEASLQTMRHYIDCNPMAWQQDQLHPDNPSKW